MNVSVDHPNQTGFSLTELMAVMIIIVLLTLLVYPSYHNLILQGRRAEARASLLATLLQQERYYTLHHTYFAFDINTPDSPFKWWSGASGATSFYEIQAKNCPNKTLRECVLLTATPGTANVRPNMDPLCGSLMLDSANNKTYSRGTEPNASCW